MDNIWPQGQIRPTDNFYPVYVILKGNKKTTLSLKRKKKWNKGSIIILLHLLSDVNVCGVFNIYKLDQKEHGDNVRLTLSCLKP